MPTGDQPVQGLTDPFSSSSRARGTAHSRIVGPPGRRERICGRSCAGSGTRLRGRSEYMHFGDGSGADPYADGSELDSLCVTKALESTVTGTRAGTG
jgi:hypothetical protein